MKKYLLMLLSFSFVFAVSAQRTITGKVTDGETGETVPGANILEKGTSNGTTTDFDGNFSFSVSDGATLVVSFVGYKQQEVAVGARSVVDIALDLDVAQLAEVVVIGYGETTVKDATGSVAAVTSENFQKGLIATPEQLIQGKTAGVRITQASGAPGDGVAINIRGSNSVTANNNPLFVVDGIPLDPGGTSSAGTDVGFGSNTSPNPLSFLNPNDIESISILKDASATAIYGSRGANGVVIITTKKGRGSGTVELSSNVTISTPAKRFDLLDAEGYLDGLRTKIGRPDSLVDPLNFGNDTDWQDEVLRTTVSHNQNVSYSRGFETGSIRASFGYENQEGVVENSSLERIVGRLNGNKSFLDERLNLDAQLTISRVTNESAPLSGSAGFQGDLLGAAYSANPTWPTSIEGLSQEEQTAIIGGQLHPGNMLTNIQNESITDRFLGNFSASYEIVDGLTAKVTYGLDRSESDAFSLVSADIRGFGNGAPNNGRGAWGLLGVTNNLFEATMSYNGDFGNSTLELVGGYSYQDFRRDGFNAQGFGFSSTDFGVMEDELEAAVRAMEDAAFSQVSADFIQQIGFAEQLNGGPEGAPTTGGFANVLLPSAQSGVPVNISGVPLTSSFVDYFDTTDKLQSFFGRANYSLQNKYLFTFTFRADGSSRFGADNQYGFFPSGAVAWKLSEEDFISDAFSTLKLRLSGGITGNQEGLGYGNQIRRERYIGLGFNQDGAVTITGTEPVSFRNDELQWEETNQIGLGIDFGLNNDRFYGSIDIYRKSTDGQLLRITSAQPAPQPFVFLNLDAQVVNQGVELALGYDIISTDDLTFTADFNISYNDNELQDFDGQIPAGTIRGQGLTGAFAQQLEGDQELFSFYLREFSGFDAEGQPIQVDQQTFVGQGALPEVNTGLNLSVSWKDWDFATFFAGQFGHGVYNNTRNAFFTAGSLNSSRNVTEDVLTNGEAPTAAAEVSTRFLERGDFVRLQTLSIGYRVPVSNTFIDNLRVSFNAQNLFLITGYDGLDPEVSVQPSPVGLDLLNGLPIAGIDYTAFPRPRVFTIGINAAF